MLRPRVCDGVKHKQADKHKGKVSMPRGVPKNEATPTLEH